MNKLLIVIIVCFSVTGFYAQKNVENGAYNTLLKTLLSHSVPEISCDSLSSIQESLTLLDAREWDEFNVSHIPEAVHVGYDHFDMNTIEHLDRTAPIIVYCSIGFRSEKIAEKLLANGFENVSNLYGGIFEWKNQDHSVVNEEGPTEQVHGYSRAWGIWLHEGEKVYD